MALRFIAKQFLNKSANNSQVASQRVLTLRLSNYPFYNFSSVIKLEMPSLSPTMNEGNLLTWNKKEGDKVNIGDVLCEIQTDKATIGFESQEEGYLAKIIVGQDTKQVEVGKLIGLMVEEKEDIACIDMSKYTQPQKAAPIKIEEKKQDSPKSTQGDVCPITGKPRTATQQAMKRAINFDEEYHKQESNYLIAPSAGWYLHSYKILPNEVKGSGPKNLIQKGDVLEFIKQNNLKVGQQRHVAQPQEVKEVKKEISKPQQQTAKQASGKSTPNDGKADRFNIKKQSWKDNQLDQSQIQVNSTIKQAKQQAPHSYLSSTCTVDQVLNNLKSFDQNLTLDIFLVKAASKALTKVLKAKNINMSRIKSDGKDKTVIHYSQTDRTTMSQLSSAKVSQTIQGSNFSNEVPQSLVEIYQVSSAAESYAIVNPNSLITLHFTQPRDEVIIDEDPSKLFMDLDHLDSAVSTSEIKLKAVKRVTLSLSFDGTKLDELQAAQILQLVQKYLNDPDSMLL